MSTDLETRVAQLEQKLAAMHEEMDFADGIRFRRAERRERESLSNMIMVGRLPAVQRIERVRQMSTADLGKYFTACDDSTVLSTFESATAEERASWMVHIRHGFYDRVRLIDEPAPARVRVEPRPGIKYRPATERREISKVQHAKLVKLGLASWCTSDSEHFYVRSLNPPEVMEAAHYTMLVETGDPIADFSIVAPLDDTANTDYQLREWQRERGSARGG